MRRFSPREAQCDGPLGPMIMHARVCATAGTRHLFVAGLSRKDGMPRVQRAESYCPWVQRGTGMCSCGNIMGLEFEHCCEGSRPRGHILSANL